MRFDELVARLEPEYDWWQRYESRFGFLARNDMTVMQAALATTYPEQFPELAGKLADATGFEVTRV